MGRGHCSYAITLNILTFTRIFEEGNIMRRMWLVAGLSVCIVALSVSCNTIQPLMKSMTVPILASVQRTLTEQDIAKIINDAAWSTGWAVDAKGPSSIQCTRKWHNWEEYSATVVIHYTNGTYDIKYVSSENLQVTKRHWDGRDNVLVIHRSYNNFVNQLRDAIDLELLRAVRG
jgi:hypothetical protein